MHKAANPQTIESPQRAAPPSPFARTKSLTLLGLCVLALGACMTNGADEVENPGVEAADSLRFSIPSSTYTVFGETVYEDDSTCYFDGNSIVCYPIQVAASKIYSFTFYPDSLDVPRVMDGHDYTFQDWALDLPCRLSLDGFLKTTIGSGSSATTIGVPAVSDSGILTPGSWRYDNVLHTYLRRTDSSLANRFDTGGISVKDLPAAYIWGGRKKTYRETVDFATAQLFDHCETYFANDSVAAPSDIGPCGAEGYPACYHNIPVCSDSGKTYQAQALNMTNDAGRIFINTDQLRSSTLSFEGKIHLTCPE